MGRKVKIRGCFCMPGFGAKLCLQKAHSCMGKGAQVTVLIHGSKGYNAFGARGQPGTSAHF